MAFEITKIGVIKTDFKEKFGTPRQSGRVKSAKGQIVIDKQFSDINAFRGIENFSHLWVIFDFSLSHSKEFSPTVRPPRLGGNTRVGVFATRSPFRPNNLGLSVVEFNGTQIVNGQVIINVSGVDMVDGPPIFDIKPYIPYADCIENAKGSFAEEYKDYKLEVYFPENLKEKFDKSLIETLLQVLSEDPRPSYIENEDRVYTFNFANFEISFSVKENLLSVLDINIIHY